jgi:(p)ppGpp synthase/HD superfamily hydrolase
MYTYTHLIRKSIHMASRYHARQFRKGDPTLPAIVHPFAVALIVSEYTEDENIIAAAALHDMLEDTACTFEIIRKECGLVVANLVDGVSVIKSDHNADPRKTWDDRKNLYYAKMNSAGFGEMLISSADKTDNINSIVDAYQTLGDALWERFNAPPSKQLVFYETVHKTLSSKFTHPLLDHLGVLIGEIRPIMAPDYQK